MNDVNSLGTGCTDSKRIYYMRKHNLDAARARQLELDTAVRDFLAKGNSIQVLPSYVKSDVNIDAIIKPQWASTDMDVSKGFFNE